MTRRVFFVASGTGPGPGNLVPVLLFQKRFHAGLLDGTTTLTFRRWQKPHVKPGGRYRVHPIGVVEVDALTQVPLSSVTDEAARRAGFTGRAHLSAWLDALAPVTPHTLLWQVSLRHAGDGDRVALALVDQLTDDDVEDLLKKLRRLDRTTRWTRQTLQLIDRHPRTPASRLAKKVKRDTEPFKVDVRKLKRLGLTVSFEVGYELSPRARAFLKRRRRW